MGKAEFVKDLTQASFEPRLSYIILRFSRVFKNKYHEISKNADFCEKNLRFRTKIIKKKV